MMEKKNLNFAFSRNLFVPGWNKSSPWRQRPQKLDPDGEPDERGHAAVRDGRGEIDGNLIAAVVHLIL